MRVPWSKRKQPEQDPTSEPVLQNDCSSPTSPGQHFSTEIVDPEKRPVNPDLEGIEEREKLPKLPPHPAVAPLADVSGNVAAEDEKTRESRPSLGEGDLARSASNVTPSESGEAGEDDESKYAKGLPLHLLTIGLTLSTFVIALDNTIIATAIPRITTVFNSLDDVGWYGSSYLLTTTSLQPSFGKIYTYFNVKWTYMIALGIFELGSVLCGAATSSSMLIVGRAVAGVGAAAIFSGGMTIVGYSVPLRKRALYIGLLSSMFGIASVVGPILGGALTDRMLDVILKEVRSLT